VPGQSAPQTTPGTESGGSGGGNGSGTREECDGDEATPGSGSGAGFRGRAPASSIRF
jgi:hypothetical protein